MNISWDDARLFLAVAESGSFTAAAKHLRVPQPTISRRIAELEYQLGWSLFHRGKRGTRLTTDGARLVEPARQMARWAAELESNVAHREKSPEGTVRLTAPPGICFDVLLEFCRQLKPKHPKLRVELLASTDHLDLSRGDADLAIRTRRPTGAELSLLTTITVQSAAFASPEYAAQLPSPCALAEVGWISWCAPMQHVIPYPQLDAVIENFVPAFASDNFLIQQRACELGLGALILGDVSHPYLRKMGLVRLTLTTPLPKSEMHLVCAKSMEHVPRVRAVARALTDVLAEIKPGDGTM